MQYACQPFSGNVQFDGLVGPGGDKGNIFGCVGMDGTSIQAVDIFLPPTVIGLS
jgi:hypothetical protein